MTREQLQQLPKAGLIAIILRQIAATDQAIDNLVYELYDLTAEEIAIVEEPTEAD